MDGRTAEGGRTCLEQTELTVFITYITFSFVIGLFLHYKKRNSGHVKCPSNRELFYLYLVIYTRNIFYSMILSVVDLFSILTFSLPKEIETY